MKENDETRGMRQTAVVSTDRTESSVEFRERTSLHSAQVEQLFFFAAVARTRPSSRDSRRSFFAVVAK